MVGTVIGLAGWATDGPARAEVNLNINIGVPPVVVVPAPPTMVFLAEPGVYVAVGVSYDIFFFSSRYYYFHDGRWFWAPGYGGPWIFVEFQSLPPGLRKFKIKQLHQYRDREFKVYKAKGPKYNGRHFVGVEGHGPKDKGLMKGAEMKESKGKEGKNKEDKDLGRGRNK
jgi:hypothetical protein